MDYPKKRIFCVAYQQTGDCPKGSSCPYAAAHKGGPLPCKHWMDKSTKCPYGDRCKFSHLPQFKDLTGEASDSSTSEDSSVSAQLA